MAAAGVVDARVNPNDPDQRIILWGNGRIDVKNGPAVTDGPEWFDRVDQPVAVAIHVIDWDEMAGYVLDHRGGFHAFGGANVLTLGGEYNNEVVGVPYWFVPIYKDWSWDPYNPGRGYVLDGFGTIHAFGGAPANTFRPGNRWVSAGIARKLQVSWGPVDIRAYTLDLHGGIHNDFSAVPVPGGARPHGIPYWRGADVARDFVVTDFGASPKGYTLDHFGVVHEWGGAESAFGFRANTTGDWGRVLKVLNADDPLTLWQVWSYGQEQEWIASTPPTVTAGGIVNVSPAATVTGTTRPMLAWDYSDPQRDSQAAWQVYVFTAAFVASHTMTDPSVHAASALVDRSGTDPTTRGAATPVDLPNGQYRMYVRAKDTAGQWSAWSSRPWTQNVPLPATPTGLSATVVGSSVALSVSATTGGTANLVRFEFSDDGTTWTPVDGADAVPIAATTTAVDRFAPQGLERTYRAVAYSVDPRVASLPSNTDTATLPILGYLLHARDNALLGGEVPAVGPFEWNRPVVAGTFEGIGAKYPTVVSDGQPKGRRGTLRIIPANRAEWATVVGLAEADSDLVLRDPFGEVVYCRLGPGDWSQRLLEAAPTEDEVTPLRHMHSTGLPLVEVRPPHMAA